MEFKKSDRVRVIETPLLTPEQYNYIGQKGKVKTANKGAAGYNLIEFKNGVRLYFISEKLELVKVKKRHSSKSKPSKSSQIAELTAKVAEQAEKIVASLEFLNELNTITWGAFTKEGIEEMIGRLKG